MKLLRFTMVLVAVCTSMSAQSQTAGQTSDAAQTQPPVKARKQAAAAKGKSLPDTCDAQFEKVCVISLDHLRRDKPPHNPHNKIVIHQGHLVVWVADHKERFHLNKFELVDCADKSKRIENDKDPGPFDKSYLDSTNAQVKYATATGTVHACYKHSIEVDLGNGKTEHIDPHIMIDVPDGP